MRTDPLVSIIIPTYNNQRTIGLCLESIFRQNYEAIEVIVVDNFSDDGTVEICRGFEVEVIQRDCGMAKARRVGAEKSRGTYLLHLDSDMELTPMVVEKCVAKCDNGYDALIIPEKNIGDGYWAACTDIVKKVANATESGYLRFLRKDLYERVGGHDEELVAGEDADLHIRVVRAGSKVGFVREEIRHHIGKVSLGNVLSKQEQYAKTTPQFLAKIDSCKDNNKSKGSHFFDHPETILRILFGDLSHSVGFLFLSLLNAIVVRWYWLKGKIRHAK